MILFKKRRTRKRLRQRAGELAGIRDAAIERRDAAVKRAAESLDRARAAMRVDVSSESGALRGAQIAIWEIQQDLRWPKALKRCEVGLGLARSGTSAAMAEEAVLTLEWLANCAGERLAGMAEALTAVCNARECADGLAEVLTELPVGSVDQMIMCAPTLAEAVFRQKGRIDSDMKFAVETLGASLEGRRRQVEVAARLPHRRRISVRTKSLVNLALSGGAGRTASDLQLRHESVGAAASAVHKDQFGREAAAGRRMTGLRALQKECDRTPTTEQRPVKE